MLDLKAKAAIGKLFRAFNRKPSEDQIENFLEFTQGYPFMVLKAAIDREIEAAEKMPTPAKIKQNCDLLNPRDRFICTDCEGNGYLFSEPRHDDYGFDYVKGDHATKCPCITALSPGHPPIISSDEVKLNSIARILARNIAVRSLAYIDDLPTWRARFWSTDTRQRWINGAKLISGLNALAGMAYLIEKADPEQCSTNPFKIAANIIEERNGKAIGRQGKKMGKASRFFNL